MSSSTFSVQVEQAFRYAASTKVSKFQAMLDANGRDDIEHRVREAQQKRDGRTSGDVESAFYRGYYHAIRAGTPSDSGNA